MAVSSPVEAFPAGAGPTPEPHRVLTTVLFTDLVGSTERVVALGDRRWYELLERYQALVRRELARFGGREVDTAGDGCFATFDSPARAIGCAGAIGAGARRLGLAVRAGVHAGECEVVGPRVRGIAVHVGARVAAHARAGEVLVSGTVKAVVAGSDIRFRDRGRHALKGLPGEWHLFAAEVAPDRRPVPRRRPCRGIRRPWGCAAGLGGRASTGASGR